MTALFGILKHICPPDSLLSERRGNLLALVRRYGYLPWSHQRALNELSAAGATLVVDKKLR
jgi:hypothetical protein